MVDRRDPMPENFKLSALLLALLAVLFCCFFEFTKHNPVLSPVNPFADDPYDAIGSFGIQAAAVLAALSLLRAFWPYATDNISEKQKALLVRTQMMAVLAVGITLAGDAIAMARHTRLWLPSRGGHLLFELIVGMALLTAAAGIFVYRAIPDIRLQKSTNASGKAAIVSIAAILVLPLYPESLRNRLAGELFAVLVGDILLFIPLSFLAMALVPDQGEIDFLDPLRFAWAKLREHQWKLILFVGMLMGLILALAELREANGWPHLTGHIALVLGVFIALETAGLLLGYAVLRKPMGLS